MAEEPIREAFTPRDAVTYEMTEDGPRQAPDQVITRESQPGPATDEPVAPSGPETAAEEAPGPAAPPASDLPAWPIIATEHHDADNPERQEPAASPVDEEK
jgi:hypothetical protein